MSKNKYLVAKGKALGMIREFEKIYPTKDVRPIIVREVMFAIDNEFEGELIDYKKVASIIEDIVKTDAPIESM